MFYYNIRVKGSGGRKNPLAEPVEASAHAPRALPRETTMRKVG